MPPTPESMDISGSLRITLACLGLVANLLQTVFCITRKRYRTNFDMSLMSMSIADIISCVIFALFGMAEIMYSLPFAKVMTVSLNFTVITMFTHIIFIAVQRLLAVIYPLRIKWILRRSRFYILLTFTWVTACGYGLISVLAIVDYVRVNSYMILVCGSAIIALYTGISYTTRKESKNLQKTGQIHNRRRNSTVLLHSFLVTMNFITCFFPFAIVYLFVTPERFSSLVIDMLVTLNPLLDSVTYFYMRHCTRKQKPPRIMARYMRGILNVSYVPGQLEATEIAKPDVMLTSVKPYTVCQ